MKVFISQSNYIPWRGYFDAIQQADVFVLYDDVQYTKRDWRNRNQIKTPGGLRWLTIPVKVKGRYLQKIDEVEIADEHWANKHWQCIVQNYHRTPFFYEYSPLFEALYQSATDHRLSRINQHFLTAIAKMLGITTQFRWSSEFDLEGNKSEKLLQICEELQATHYITGPAARNYLDEDLFRQAGKEIIWMDYSGYPEYPQLFTPFEGTISIIDLLFNTGPAATLYMKSSQYDISHYRRASSGD